MEILTFAIAGFACLMLALGVLDFFAAKLKAPLPILAALLGVAVGVLIVWLDPAGQGLFLDSYDQWFLSSLVLTPQSVVVIFLPPLLFEVTLGVDVRKLRQDIVIVAVMAVVAVIVATGIVGATLTLVAGLPLLACLLLGATISTTDPAAVVAIFRRIGAPRRLLIVLEGESLLNDAAAIALFVLFINMLSSGAAATPWEVVASFFYLLAIGALSGFAIGRMASILMNVLRNGFMAQTSLMLATAYASYLVAEQVLGASGVVAVVAAGLTVTVSGSSRVSSEEWNAVRTVWSQIGYWANGLIVLIAAALSPALLLKLEWWGFGLIFLVIIAALIARAVILFGLLPALDLIGLSAPMTRQQKLLIWWGGIRGAVTLLLALSLSAKSALPDELGTQLAAVGIGFVFFTLFVNGSTLAFMTRALGLDRLGSSDLALRRELIGRTIRGGLEHVDGLAFEHELPPAIFTPVRDDLVNRLARFDAEDDDMRPSFGDRLRTGLIVIANQERRLVRQHYDGGIVGRETMRHLQRVAERLADAAITEGRDGYTEQAEVSIQYPRVFRIAVALQRYLGINRPISSLLARRFRLLFEWQLILKELLKFVDGQVESLLGEDVANNLHDMIAERRRVVQDAAKNLELQYPDYAETLQQGFVARAVLRWEAGRYNRFLRQAIIGPDLHLNLMRDLDERVAATYRGAIPDTGFDRNDLLRKVPLFKSLNPADMKRLARAFSVRSALPGDVLAARGARGDAMFFVASGALEMSDGKTVSRLGTGDFFGELALLQPTRRRISFVVATGFCRLLVLRRERLKKLASKSPSLLRAIEEAARSRGLKLDDRKGEPETGKTILSRWRER